MSYHQLRILNTTDSLAEVRDTVKSLLQQAHYDEANQRKVVLAIDEAVNNVIEHAYAKAKPGTASISLAMRVQDERFEVVIEDSGAPMPGMTAPKRLIWSATSPQDTKAA